MALSYYEIDAMNEAAENGTGQMSHLQNLPKGDDNTLQQDLQQRYNCINDDVSSFEHPGRLVASPSGSKVFVKRVLRSALQAAQDMDREITVQSTSLDPSILLLIESLELRDVMWTVTEYRPLRTLAELIQARGPMSDAPLRVALNQLFSGVATLFMAGFAHLRITDQTICFDDRQQLIITGLQYACEYGKEKVDDMYALTREKHGDDIFVAPEVFACLEYNARKATIWSCGVLLYFMTTGQTEKLSILGHPSFDRLAQEPATVSGQQQRRRHASSAGFTPSHRRMSSAGTQSKFVLSLSRMNLPNYARWIIPKMLAQEPKDRPELIEIASRVPKDYDSNDARPLIEKAWLDYKTHVGPLAGLDIPSPNQSSASSLYSMASAMSNPFRSLLGRGSSRRQSAPVGAYSSGW